MSLKVAVWAEVEQAQSSSSSSSSSSKNKDTKLEKICKSKNVKQQKVKAGEATVTRVANQLHRAARLSVWEQLQEEHDGRRYY